MKDNNSKSIETSALVIKENIMSWEGTMVQLSNVACVSTFLLKSKPFPKWTIVSLLATMFFLEYNGLMATVALVVTVLGIWHWHSENKRLSSTTYLNIVLNSGDNLQFVVTDKEFLQKILDVLYQIMIKGGVGNKNVFINLKNNKITGDAAVLNELNI